MATAKARKIVNVYADGDNIVVPNTLFQIGFRLDTPLGRGQSVVVSNGDASWTITATKNGYEISGNSFHSNFTSLQDGAAFVFVVASNTLKDTTLDVSLHGISAVLSDVSTDLTIVPPELVPGAFDPARIGTIQTSDAPVVDGSGVHTTLFGDTYGKLLLLDISATWCKPSYDIVKLHEAIGDAFTVKTLLTTDLAYDTADQLDAAGWATNNKLSAHDVLVYDGSNQDARTYFKLMGADAGVPLLAVIDPATGLILYSFNVLDANLLTGIFNDDVAAVSQFVQFVTDAVADGTVGIAGLTVTPDDATPMIQGSFFEDSITVGQGSHLVHGGYGADMITVGDGNNYIYAEDGNDTIVAGNGINYLYGGNGNDSIFAANGVASIIDGGDGDDIIVSSGTAPAPQELASGLQATINGGNGNDRITGSDFKDNLMGNAGDDVIVAGGGTDYVRADLGNDIVYGGDGNDDLGGGNGDDQVYGEDGDDTYTFNPNGNDLFDGGDGYDVVLFDGLSVSIRVVLADDGSATITQAGGTTELANVEDLDARNALVSVALSGNSGSNYLYGSSNNDALASGGAVGADGDYLDGRGGDDEILLSAGNVVAFGGSGNDVLTVEGPVQGSLRGGADFDWPDQDYDVLDLSQLGAGVRVTYVQGENTIDQAGRILGGGMDVRIDNFDEIRGTGFEDRMRGGALGDIFVGNGGDDALLGEGGDDFLLGGDGKDVLNGGTGSDVLIGGAGADRFVFEAGYVGSTDLDVIDDFEHRVDRVDLKALDAKVGVAGDQAFSWIGAEAFSGAAGQLRAEQVDGDTYVQGDVNGDGVADFQIVLSGEVTLTARDFIL